MDGTRCVVTGLGVICSIGNNLPQVWDSLVNGECGVKEITSFDVSKCYSKIGAEIKNFEPSFKYSLKKHIRRMDRVSLLCIEAAKEALEDSGLSLQEVDMQRAGVVIGSCTGGVLSSERFLRDLLSENRKTNPLDIIQIPIHTIASNVSLFLGTRGTVTNIGNACAAGTLSISYACDLIKSGSMDIVFAGGSDALAALQYSGFHALKALDTVPCSPFSRSKGISLGEGSAVLVIESIEHALKRNAKIYCEVAGYGNTSDAYHITAPNPSGDGQISAIRKAISSASAEEGSIDYINAHGTGTPLNDNAEKESMKIIFGKYKDKLKISSSKSMIGHCLGAAGSIEAVIAIKAQQCNEIPPTINYEENDSTEGFDFVPNKKINKDLGIVMSNSFAFGGNNASILFSRDKNTECNIKKNNNKVFITGLGIVSPIGLTKEGYWDNAINNISGISRLETNKNNYVANVKIEDFAQHGIEPGFLRKIDRLTKLLLISGRESLKDAGINVSDDFSDKIGLVVGTSDGPVSEIRNFLEGMIKRGIHSGSPLIFPNTVYNAACGYLSIIENIKGYALTLVNGISSGIDSVCHSYDMLKFGRQEIFIASGVDEYSETIHILYDTLNALYEGDEPSKQPFNFSQKGFIMGEGSTSIVLETEESANKRGACCYAEVIGYSHSNTPVGAGKLDKDGFGLDSAIKLACKNANIGLEEIDAIVGFANGSSDIDTMELKSYIRTFGNKFSSIPIYSVKSLTGEGRAAASSLQIAHAALMLHKNHAPSTRTGGINSIRINDNIVELREESDKELKNILVTSFSYGGSFSAIILSKP